MNWYEVLAVIIPLISFMGWVYHRIDKKFDKIDARFDTMDKKLDFKIDALDKKFDFKIDALDKKFESKFDSLSHDIRDLSKDVQSIDSRIARIEGQLTPTQVHYFEPKIKVKGDEE